MVIRGELLQMTVEQMLTGILEARALETGEAVSLEISLTTEGKFYLTIPGSIRWLPTEGKAVRRLQEAVQLLFDYLVTDVAKKAEQATKMLALLGASKPKSAPTLPLFDGEEGEEGDVIKANHEKTPEW